MEQELGLINDAKIIKEEEIIKIYIESTLLPEKEAFIKDFLYQFNNQRHPVSIEGDYYKLELFRS